MHSALAGAFALLSIGILMAHAMEGHWLRYRRAPVIKDTASLRRTSRTRP
jgi:hypothetical protein